MKRRAAALVLVAALAALVGGFVVLFRLRLGRGDSFPAYSTLRADPLGTRALHDSLARLPGLRVERGFKRLATTPATPPRTLILAGFSAATWTSLDLEEFNALDAAVRAGSRLVVAFHADTADHGPSPVAGKPAEQPKTKAKNPPTDGNERPRAKALTADLQRLWGLELRLHQLDDRGDGAARATEDRLPARVAWRSDLHFRAAQGVEWTTLYRRGGEAVMLERTLGRGSLVVAGDAFFLSNEALQRDRSTALLAWIVGPHGRVVFDETHLGVTADPGIAALARRYGLAGAFFVLLLLAALWIWQRMALFVPPAEEHPEVLLGYHPAAGLEALLRRSVPASELAETCVAEWRRTARPAEIARVERALAAAPEDTAAATRHNLALAALRRR